MLNIVIPMAGAGSRFAVAGYELPKPLIRIHDHPMIQLVINNVRPRLEHRFTFVVQESHLRDFGLLSLLRGLAPNCNIVGINGVTDGAACTVLMAKKYIDNSNPLMIVNSDQYVDAKIDDYLSIMLSCDFDGLIMTMDSSHPKWSYVKLGPGGLVENVVEKEVISRDATVGVYNFKYGRDFVTAAEAMIAANHRSNGEFYVAPVYNYLVREGKRIGCWSIGEESKGMHGLGTPEDLQRFQRNELSRLVEAELRRQA